MNKYLPLANDQNIDQHNHFDLDQFDKFISLAHFFVIKKRTTAHLRTPFHYFQLTRRALTVPLLLPSRLHGDRSHYSFVVDESFLRARATRKKQGQRAPPFLHRNSDGKSCLEFPTFITYLRAKCTFMVHLHLCLPGQCGLKIHESKKDRRFLFVQFYTVCLLYSYVCSVRTGQADRGINAPLK